MKIPTFLQNYLKYFCRHHYALIERSFIKVLHKLQNLKFYIQQTTHHNTNLIPSVVYQILFACFSNQI